MPAASLTAPHPACPPLILDARLALETGGFSFALRLSRFVDVWLTREFVVLIDPDNDMALEPGDEGPAGDERLRTALEVWRTAFATGIVHGAFHWLGEKSYESRQPDPGAAVLIRRYEHLTACLDPDVKIDCPVLVTCSLQAVALAATLEAHSPLLLCRAASQGPLDIASDLRGSGLEGAVASPQTGLSGLLPPAADSVLAVGRAMRLDVALVAVIAPRAMLAYDPDAVPARAGGPGVGFERLRPWEGAMLVWERLS